MLSSTRLPYGTDEYPTVPVRSVFLLMYAADVEQVKYIMTSKVDGRRLPWNS